MTGGGGRVLFIGRSPVWGIRPPPEWEVTTAREPVIVSPKCSIFTDAGMQIKCQLGGEDMKHWHYEVLKSLKWKWGVCTRLVIAAVYSVLPRKYIPYPIYQTCLGRYSGITWSVSHKLGRMQNSHTPLRFKPDRWGGGEGEVWQGITYSYQEHWYCVLFYQKKKKSQPF